jgi:hypothetical protein
MRNDDEDRRKKMTSYGPRTKNPRSSCSLVVAQNPQSSCSLVVVRGRRPMGGAHRRLLLPATVYFCLLPALMLPHCGAKVLTVPGNSATAPQLRG